MSTSQNDFRNELLACTSHTQVLAHIEEHAHQYECGAGSVALHVLAATARPLGAEARQIGATHAVGRLVMQLGGQLAGGTELDANGLVALLWALATLAPLESALLSGLVGRILLLTSRAACSPAQLHISTQAIAALGLLASGPTARKLAIALLPRIGSFNAAQLGDLLRAFAIPPTGGGGDEADAVAHRAEGAIEAFFREALRSTSPPHFSTLWSPRCLLGLPAGARSAHPLRHLPRPASRLGDPPRAGAARGAAAARRPDRPRRPGGRQPRPSRGARRHRRAPRLAGARALLGGAARAADALRARVGAAQARPRADSPPRRGTSATRPVHVRYVWRCRQSQLAAKVEAVLRQRAAQADPTTLDALIEQLVTLGERLLPALANTKARNLYCTFSAPSPHLAVGSSPRSPSCASSRRTSARRCARSSRRRRTSARSSPSWRSGPSPPACSATPSSGSPPSCRTGPSPHLLGSATVADLGRSRPQDCPDPDAWAASLTAGPDFAAGASRASRHFAAPRASLLSGL